MTDQSRIDASAGLIEVGELTSRWALFASTVLASSVPKAALDGACRAITGALHAAVNSTDDELVTTIADTVSGLGSPPRCTAVGPVRRLGPTYAALVNGAAARSKAANGDDLVAALAASVVPAGFAAAQFVSATGADLLVGVLVGLEFSLRLARALGPTHRSRGWDLAGTAGHLGAAVAAARVLGLSAPAQRVAIGVSATEAAGLELSGRPIVAIVAGKAAADGVEAALFARSGLIGPPGPLEGRRGLFALMSDDPDPTRLTDGLGEVWQLAGAGGSSPVAVSDDLDDLVAALSTAATVDALAGGFESAIDRAGQGRPWHDR